MLVTTNIFKNNRGRPRISGVFYVRWVPNLPKCMDTEFGCMLSKVTFWSKVEFLNLADCSAVVGEFITKI